MSAIIKCAVCTDAEGKYRCARCRSIRYCSIICYNKHIDESCTGAQNSMHTSAEQTPAVVQDAPPQGFIKGLNIEAIMQNGELMGALQDPKLQSVIRFINDAPTDAHRVAALSDELERNPEFTQFVYSMVQCMQTKAEQLNGVTE